MSTLTSLILLFLLFLISISKSQNVDIILYTPYIISDPNKIYVNQSIEIYTNNYWIKSNKATIDKTQKKIYIPQNTFIKNLATGDEFQTEKLQITYDQDGKILEILGDKGEGFINRYEEISLQDKLFFSYSKLYIFSNKYLFNDVKFSTCDLCHYHDFDHKHYIIGSEKVEIIPEDKMILTNSKLFLYKKQLFGYKKLIIPLKKRRLPSFKEDMSTFPQVGYNNTDGFFISKQFDYYLNNSNYGKILTKYGQNTGMYYGISNYLNINTTKIKINNQNYILLNNNKKYGSKFRNINSNLNLTYDSINAFFRYSSNRSIYRNYTSPLSENFSYGINSYLGNVRINYTSNTTSTEGQFSSSNRILNLSGTYKGINFYFNFNDLENNYFLTNKTQRSQNTKLNVDYLLRDFSISWLLDNTRNNYGFFGINKLPELTIKLNKPFQYKSRITLSPTIFLGKYQEPQFNRKTTKYQFLVNYNINIIKEKNVNWQTNGFFKQNFYHTGKYYSDRNFHASYVHSFNSTLNLNQKNFKLNINYVYNFGKGFAPIFADFTGTYQNLSANLSIFNNKTFDLNLSTNYNLNLGSISPISINFKYFPSKRFYSSIFTTFDTRRSNFTNINTNIDWYITEDLRITTWFNYNTFSKKIDYLDFIIIKDNHCWVSYLVYRSSIKQLYLYAYLKALPIVGINIGIDQSSKFIPINR